MPTMCTRCGGSGFLNIHQIPYLDIEDGGTDEILEWIEKHTDHDVAVCDCCGDGENWHGKPGEHYNPEDPAGPDGPYSYNGGLCECN